MEALLKNLWSIGKVLLPAWLFLAISQAGYSIKEVDCNLRIFGSLKIDVCGEPQQKEFILLIDIGRVNPQDSLFGFNYEIIYEPTKVQMTDALYVNTLSEGFEIKAVSFNSKESKIIGYAATMGNFPVFGEKPLIAFLGKWISNCPDTATFKLNFIEFTEEFKINIRNYNDAILIGEVSPLESRNIKTNFSQNILKKKDNDTNFKVQMDFTIPRKSRIENFAMNFVTETSKIIFDSITTLSNDIELLFFERNNEIQKAHFKVINDDGLKQSIGIFGRIIFTSSTFTETITTKFEFDNECKCVNLVGNDTLRIEYEIEPTIVDFEKNEFNIDLSKFEQIKVYDIMGNMVLQLGDDLTKTEIRNLPYGVYFMIYTDTNKNVVKKEIYLNY